MFGLRLREVEKEEEEEEEEKSMVIYSWLWARRPCESGRFLLQLGTLASLEVTVYAD